jgi:hypothetical protein
VRSSEASGLHRASIVCARWRTALHHIIDKEGRKISCPSRLQEKYSGESRNAGLCLKLRHLFLRGLDIVVTDAEFHYDASFTTVIQPSDSLMAKHFQQSNE